MTHNLKVGIASPEGYRRIFCTQCDAVNVGLPAGNHADIGGYCSNTCRFPDDHKSLLKSYGITDTSPSGYNL